MKKSNALYSIEDEFDSLSQAEQDMARSLCWTLQVNSPVIQRRGNDFYFLFSYYDGDPEYYFEDLNIQQDSQGEYNYLNLSELVRNPPDFMKSAKKMKKSNDAIINGLAQAGTTVLKLDLDEDGMYIAHILNDRSVEESESALKQYFRYVEYMETHGKRQFFLCGKSMKKSKKMKKSIVPNGYSIEDVYYMQCGTEKGAYLNRVRTFYDEYHRRVKILTKDHPDWELDGIAIALMEWDEANSIETDIDDEDFEELMQIVAEMQSKDYKGYMGSTKKSAPTIHDMITQCRQNNNSLVKSRVDIGKATGDLIMSNKSPYELVRIQDDRITDESGLSSLIDLSDRYHIVDYNGRALATAKTLEECIPIINLLAGWNVDAVIDQKKLVAYDIKYDTWGAGHSYASALISRY